MVFRCKKLSLLKIENARKTFKIKKNYQNNRGEE
jgi:hypothetical protein